MNLKLFKGLVAVAAIAFSIAAPSARAAAVTPPDEPVLIDTSASAGSVVESSPTYSSYTADRAFDGNWSDDAGRWLALTSSNPMYLVYKFNVATKVNMLRLRIPGNNSYDKRSPKAWTFSGSNDGSTWTTLDTRSGVSWSASEVKTVSFSNDTAYEYYRFSCTAIVGSDDYMMLWEIQFFYEPPSLVDLTSPSGNISTTTSGSWVKPAKNAFDNGTALNNDDRSIHSGSAVDWIYTFDTPTKVNAYRVFAPGSSPYYYDKRMPKTWTFEAKNAADASWTILDTQSSETGWTALEKRYYAFENNTAYDSYRFAVTAHQDDSDNYVQIDELEFYYINTDAPSLGVVGLERTGAAAYDVFATMKVNSADLSWIADDGATASTNLLAAGVAEGASVTNSLSGLSANTTYQISVLATNASGTAEAVAGTLYTGELSLGATTDANEYGLVPGGVVVSRVGADPWPLTVNYTISGSAGSQGATWAAPLPVEIPAGEASATLPVKPLIDGDVTEDITITVTLAAGNYEIPAASATLTLVNLVAPAGYNVWVAPSNSLASIASNWSEGHSPTASENVLFNGDFSTADCEWDAASSAIVASWTQNANYTGTVTFDIKYPVTGDAFQTFTVTGACVVNGGAWTHPVSVNMAGNLSAPTIEQLRAAYTYRLNIAAGSFTLGSGATISAVGKGHSQPHVKSLGAAGLKPAHGGCNAGSTVSCYGNPKYPEDIGYASNLGSDNANKCAPGGGAIKLAVDGACVVDGTITVDGMASSGNLAAGAAGSILIEATSISGSGSIFARAVSCNNNNYPHGVGGRIALLTTNAVDTAALTISAGAAGDFAAASGTVYLRDGTMTNGVLVVRNPGRTYSDPLPGRRTEPTTEGDWSFDRIELGGDVQFAVPFGKTLSVPGWDCVSAPYNASSAVSGLYYIGGTLDFGSAADVTLSGRWYFAPISNYVFNANVSLADGASIGFGGKFPQALAGSAHPVDVDRIRCTVNGDLTVPNGCSVNVNLAGAMQNSNSTPADYPLGAHGGRRSNTMKTIGSVFHPRTLPHGQSNSYGHIIPGGAVELVVSGTLTLGGTITATGYTGNDGINSQVGGGSIDISAGRLAGTGAIKAGAVKNGQPGGRIAIRLTGAGATLDDFEGTINCATMGNGSVGSCGSIYIQTAADGEGCGTVIFDDNNVTCTTYTPICAKGYEADDIDDFKCANLVIRNQAKAQVSVADANGTFKMGDIEIDGTGELDLCGNTFAVKSARLGGTKLSAGMYAAGDEAVAGFVTDSGEGGELVVTGGGFYLFVR